MHIKLPTYLLTITLDIRDSDMSITVALKQIHLIRRCYHGPHLHLPPEKWHRHCPTHWSLVLLTYKINGEVVVLLILHTAIVTIAFCQLVFNKRLSIYLSIYLSVYLSIYLSRKNQGTYWYKHKHHVGIWH